MRVRYEKEGENKIMTSHQLRAFCVLLLSFVDLVLLPPTTMPMMTAASADHERIFLPSHPSSSPFSPSSSFFFLFFPAEPFTGIQE